MSAIASGHHNFTPVANDPKLTSEASSHDEAHANPSRGSPDDAAGMCRSIAKPELSGFDRRTLPDQ